MIFVPLNKKDVDRLRKDKNFREQVINIYFSYKRRNLVVDIRDIIREAAEVEAYIMQMRSSLE